MSNKNQSKSDLEKPLTLAGVKRNLEYPEFAEQMKSLHSQNIWLVIEMYLRSED